MIFLSFSSFIWYNYTIKKLFILIVCCLSFSCATFGGRFAENFPEDEFVVSDIGFFGPVMNHTKQFYPMFDFEALFTK